MKSIFIRISAPFIIILLALLAFENGVVVEYKPDLGDEPVGILVFHVISFFTFGAKDYGPPVAGPLFWQSVLYFVYYAAPVICLSALAETIYLLSKPFLPLLLYRKKHYLIIGYGRVGKAAASYLREMDPDCRIVVLDSNPHQSPGGVNLFRWKFLFLQRDMNDPKALDGLRLDHCKEVFLLTDQEWLNLKLYYAIKDKMNDINTRMFVRVSSIDLISFLRQKNQLLIKEGADTEKPSVTMDNFFNVHMAACHQLFDQSHINDMLRKEYNQFRSWKETSIESLIFFGFGRFGSAFLHEMMQYVDVVEKSFKIIIVDPKADEAWKRFEIDYPQYPSADVHLIKSGMEDMAMLEKAFLAIDHGHSVAVFGSNLETHNIRYATAFHKMYDRKDEIRYIIRAGTKNNFPEKLLEKFLGTNFILIPTYDWVKAYFEDQHMATGHKSSIG
jgi:hypothetical protein